MVRQTNRLVDNDNEPHKREESISLLQNGPQTPANEFEEKFMLDEDPLDNSLHSHYGQESAVDNIALWLAQLTRYPRLAIQLFLSRQANGRAPSFDAENGVLKYPGDTLHISLPPRHAWTRRFLDLLRSLLLFLLPSFIRVRWFPTDADLQPIKIHPTSYLDGLRGVAAFSVFIFHMTNNVYEQVMYGYGGGEPGQNVSLLQLPIIKLACAGPAAVSMFFVVSGFALSIKPLKQMRARQFDGLLQTLSSSTFRRPIRLFLPCFLSTFIIFLIAYVGVFDLTRFIAQDHTLLTGKHKGHLTVGPNFVPQFGRWMKQAIGMVSPFDGWSQGRWQGFYSDYDTHLWTIPIEFRASLALFLTQLGVARMRSSLRMILTFLLMIWAVRHDRWEMLLFWGGGLIAELDLCIQAWKSKRGDHFGELAPRIWSGMLIANFILGLFLLSYPDESGSNTPGYIALTAWIPKAYSDGRRFWQGVGALLTVFSVSQLPTLSKIFATGVIRYLGKISFALYLMHALVNHTVGYAAFYIMWSITGHDTEGSQRAGFLLAAAVIVPSAIWAADVFWRLGDIPSLNFARWLETKLLSKDEQV